MTIMMTYTIRQHDGAVIYRGPSAEAAWLCYDVLDQIAQRYPRHQPTLTCERGRDS